MEKTQYVTIAIGTLFLCWFMAPLVAKGIVNIGNVTGLFISALIICYGIFGQHICQKVLHLWANRAGRIFLIALLLLAVCIAATVIVETIWIIAAASRQPPANTTAVVLGCRVNGTTPSRILSERIDAAYEYLETNPEAICILSGGQGEDEDISEAQSMCEHLAEKGIDKHRLILEDLSTTTDENLKFSTDILKRRGLPQEVTVITSEFHEYRAVTTAERMGLKSYSTPSHTCLLYLPTYYVRELYGILYYRLAR